MGTNLTVIDRELTTRLPIFQQVLPPSVSPQRLMRTVMMSIERLPKLLDCTPQSIINAATTAAVLGLECDGVTGQGYLIPYGNVAQFQIGYKGYNTLASRAGYTVNGAVVREQDEFEYSLGTGGYVRHKPLLERVRERRIIAAWATAESTGRPAIVAIMSIDEILEIKARSKGAKKLDSPWNDATGPGFAAMCEKTVKRRLARSMPLSVMQLANALDSAVEEGHQVHLEPDGNLKVVGSGTADDAPRTAQPAEILTPANEWPTHNTRGEWAKWSRDKFLLKASVDQAKAWHAHYGEHLKWLHGMSGKPDWEKLYTEVMDAYGKAVARGGI